MTSLKKKEREKAEANARAVQAFLLVFLFRPRKIAVLDFAMYIRNYVFQRCVVELATIMQRVDSARLFWLFLGLFSYENHEGKPRI
ncbi:unnamed protein product [Victoria cruziana]